MWSARNVARRARCRFWQAKGVQPVGLHRMPGGPGGPGETAVQGSKEVGTMRTAIRYGHKTLELEISVDRLGSLQRAAIMPSQVDPIAALRDALEKPFDFPALRRALTPDDHLAILVDEQLPRLPELLTVVLEHVAQAGIHPGAITLVCARTASRQDWVEDLPDEWQDVRVEVHDPTERRRLSYLAATQQGRRIYLNRTLVDAEQSIVLTRLGHHPIHGATGGMSALFPTFSDEATLREQQAVRLESGTSPQQDAREVAWLLGAPFLVQFIEGAGDEVCHVIAGSMEAASEGRRLFEARWNVQIDNPPDMVIASLSGDPTRHDFAAFARAAAAAAQLVEPDGRIVLLTEATPTLGDGAEVLRRSGDPAKALARLQQEKPEDRADAFLWAGAARRARIYLLSGLTEETTEELFAVPLEDASQVQRLLGEGGSCLLLEDAHKVVVG